MARRTAPRLQGGVGASRRPAAIRMRAIRPCRGVLAGLLLLGGPWAVAQSPADRQDGPSTNVARRYRGRRLYDRQIEWHQMAPGARVPAQERDPPPGAEGAGRGPRVEGLLQSGGLSPPPPMPMTGPLRPREREEDSSAWIMSSVEEVMGVSSATNVTTGWGWLADQIQSNRTAAAEAAAEVAEEEEGEGGMEGLIQGEAPSALTGLVTEPSSPLTGVHLRLSEAPVDAAGSRVLPGDRFESAGLLPERSVSGGPAGPIGPDGLPRGTAGDRFSSDTRPPAPRADERPMPRMDALMPERDLPAARPPVFTPVQRDGAAAARTPGAASLSPSSPRTPGGAAWRSPSAGLSVPSPLPSTYGERGAIFAPGFRTTSFSPAPAGGGILNRPGGRMTSPLYQVNAPSWSTPSMTPPATPSDIRPAASPPRTSLLGPSWLTP